MKYNFKYWKQQKPALNRPVKASPPVGGSGYAKPSRASPFVGFAPPHFCFCEKLLRSFLYRKSKNVIYRRNVRRKFFELVLEKVYKI